MSNIDLRKYADLLLEECNHKPHIALNIDKISKALNLKIEYFDPKLGDGEYDNIRGMLDYANKTIYIQQDMKVRMRFTFAHEIAHYFLPHHKEHFASEFKKCSKWDLTSRTENSYEFEANRFAGELLFKGSYIDTLYQKQPLVDFEMIEKVYNECDVSFEATCRHMISNSPTPQILFIYYKDNPEKHPSVTCSHGVPNEHAMGIYKPIFAPIMSEIEEENFYLEEKIFNDLIIGVNVVFTQNDYKKSYIMTMHKIRKIIE